MGRRKNKPGADRRHPPPRPASVQPIRQIAARDYSQQAPSHPDRANVQVCIARSKQPDISHELWHPDDQSPSGERGYYASQGEIDEQRIAQEGLHGRALVYDDLRGFA